MKVYSTLIILLLLLFFVREVFVQKQELSWTAKRLKSQVEKGNHKSILEATESGYVTLIPYLKEIGSDLQDRNNRNHRAFFAHIGLAKLGDTEALNQILADVDNDSPAIQDRGIYKLSFVGGKEAFRKFYEVLDDTKGRANTDCIKMFKEHNKKHPNNKLSPYCDQIYFSRSVTVMFFLLKVVENPPV